MQNSLLEVLFIKINNKFFNNIYIPVTLKKNLIFFINIASFF